MTLLLVQLSRCDQKEAGQHQSCTPVCQNTDFHFFVSLLWLLEMIVFFDRCDRIHVYYLAYVGVIISVCL